MTICILITPIRRCLLQFTFFFFNDTATTEIYTLSLHDALPIYKPTMNFRGRLLWGTVDALWSAGLSDLSRKTVAMFGWDPATAGRSWRGAAISASRIAALVESIGGDLREMPAADTPLAWCCGVKKAPR